MKNEIQERLLELVRLLKEFGDAHIDPKVHWSIETTPYGSNINFHTMQEHGVGLAIMRSIGLKQADKHTYDPSAPWHSLIGSLTDKVDVKIFCQGLPPMCRIETYDEEIPKEQVIQTGEKTVVRRTRILCGEAK